MQIKNAIKDRKAQAISWSGLCVIVLLMLGLSACASGNGSSANGSPTATSTNQQPFTWIIALSALKSLEQAASSGQLAEKYFDNAQTYLLGATAQTMPSGWKCIPTASFRSYADLKQALDTNSLGSGVKAVVYDSESWSFTPAQEQQNPALYYRLAAQLAHAHHLTFIATPATDLAQAIHPVTADKYANFLNLGIARAAAKYADVYEIQAQGSEMSSSTFASFVQQAADQARAVNPQVAVLAGLSTNPTGQHVTGDDLYQAVQATRGSASGYWLNIPSGGPACPQCGVAQPQVAVDFLNKLG